jgi:hypothetical protein
MFVSFAQANFVVGAGYKIKFTFNPTASTAVEPTSAHTNARGQQVLPATTDTVTSFFIRPHTLGIVQQPGGDGVDLVAGGDGVTGTPDGVGVGTVFRVQPAVILKGDGYSFTSSWGMHGHVPITAAVKVVSCTQVDCAGSCDATSCTDGASVSITVEDTATSGVSPASIQATSATSDATLTSTFSATAGSGTVDVQVEKYPQRPCIYARKCPQRPCIFGHPAKNANGCPLGIVLVSRRMRSLHLSKCQPCTADETIRYLLSGSVSCCGRGDRVHLEGS